MRIVISLFSPNACKDTHKQKGIMGKTNKQHIQDKVTKTWHDTMGYTTSDGCVCMCARLCDHVCF